MILNSEHANLAHKKGHWKVLRNVLDEHLLPSLLVSERGHLHFLILSLEFPTIACQELANSGIGHRYFEHVFYFQDQRLSRPLYCIFLTNNSMSLALLRYYSLPFLAHN